MACEEVGESRGKARLRERCRGTKDDGWIRGREIHFDVPADSLAVELTRSLQSNLALTPLYALTHPKDKMSLSGCVSQNCAHNTVNERQSG